MVRSVIALLSLMSTALLFAGEEVKFVPTDEFDGPFPSWRDVKRDYGAKGDGVADDSDAINRGLADLKKAGREFSVLYFPAGVYRVTKTVTTSPVKNHPEASGIAVVGEDPATTVIKWDGNDKGTVFSYTAWYSKISRLTIDGSGRAAIALLYNGEKFSTYNETSDMVLKNSAVGLQFGGQGGDMGQAENMVHRCRFQNCGIGLTTMNFDSLLGAGRRMTGKSPENECWMKHQRNPDSSRTCKINRIAATFDDSVFHSCGAIDNTCSHNETRRYRAIDVGSRGPWRNGRRPRESEPSSILESTDNVSNPTCTGDRRRRAAVAVGRRKGGGYSRGQPRCGHYSGSRPRHYGAGDGSQRLSPELLRRSHEILQVLLAG